MRVSSEMLHVLVNCQRYTTVDLGNPNEWVGTFDKLIMYMAVDWK